MKVKTLLKIITHMSLYGALMFAVAALTGCSGDTGPRGPQGPPGEAGETSEVTLQDLASLGLVYSGDVTPINPVLDLSKTVSYNSSTGALTVHFFLTDESGKGIDITKIPYELRFYVSELIPAAEGPADNPGPAWNRLIYENGTPAMAAMPGALTLINAATGEYNYVLAGTLAATDHVIRVTVTSRFRFRDNNNQYIVVANPVNAHYDFLLADPGTRLSSSGADMVTTSACESCHGARIGDVGHGGSYTQVTTCNNCHNVNYMAGRDPNADLAFMIHSIHSAKNFSVGDFSEVTYPQPINNCGKCHNGPDAGLAYSNPTRMNCGSCHSNVDFATGAGHAGGPQTTDANCTGCHSADAIKGYHNPPPTHTPEFDVSLNLTPPANGQFYQAGEAPLVTVTLTRHGTGAPVDPSVYTTPQDAKGAVGGGLNVASLYVYGPRSFSVPVLATGSTTDANPANPPTQAHGLFAGGTDPLVKTDATGFKYQLMAVPQGMTAGTYMVRVRIADYGYISDTNFQLESIAFTNIQIGTSTVQHKVSGDACIDCHGAGTAPFHDARHAVVFDTDQCLACHDHSGGHADYIGNRVHAVHGASLTGDLNNRDWSEVTFPRPANNCITCHTDTTTNTPVWTTPDMVACGGCHGAMPNADPAAIVAAQNENDQDEAAELAKARREVAAAQHMAQNGGSTDPTVAPTLSCMTCHGEGRVADLFKTHKLILFRPLPVDPNQ